MPLFRLVDIVGGGTPSKQRKEFWTGSIPWVSPKDMGQSEIDDTEDHISKEAVEHSATQMVPRGTVLVVVRSGILVRRFPVAIARTAVAINQDLKALIPREVLLPEFLAYALGQLSGEILQHCVKRGATVHSVDISKFRALELPLPSLLEQRRIVEILDQASHLRRLRAEADTKADRILPALFIEMFGDPTKNARGWPARCLGDLTQHLTSGSRAWAAYTGRGSSFFLRTQDINKGEITSDLLPLDPPDNAEAERTRVRRNDVVVTITGVVGKAAVCRNSSRTLYVSQHVALVRPNHRVLHPEYLAAYANLPLGDVPVLARFQYGQTKPGLGFRELRTALIPLPPIELQAKFAEYRAALRSNTQALAASAQALDNLWGRLLRGAFSGSLTASWRNAHLKDLMQVRVPTSAIPK